MDAGKALDKASQWQTQGRLVSDIIMVLQKEYSLQNILKYLWLSNYSFSYT